MAKKASEIATLLRVQGWTVDEHRRNLGQMLAREESLLEDIKQMERQLLREQEIASAEPLLAGHGYAAFAENYRVRRATIEGVIKALRVEIEHQRDTLADAYKDLKVLEEVRTAWQKAEREEAARVEQIEMDEIAQNLYRRR